MIKRIKKFSTTNKAQIFDAYSYKFELTLDSRMSFELSDAFNKALSPGISYTSTKAKEVHFCTPRMTMFYSHQEALNTFFTEADWKEKDEKKCKI